MKALAVEIPLGIAVLSVWLGCLGFLGFRSALDRLHCATFVNVAGGTFLMLAVFLQDGASSRSFKTAALLVLMLAAGAATSHAVGRALYLHDGDKP